MHAPLFKKVQQQKRQLSLKKAGENQKIHYKLLRWIRGLIYTRTSPRCVGRNSSIHLVRVNTQAGKTNREKERRITVYNPYSPYHPPTTAPTQYKDDTHTLIEKKKKAQHQHSLKKRKRKEHLPSISTFLPIVLFHSFPALAILFNLLSASTLVSPFCRRPRRNTS